MIIPFSEQLACVERELKLRKRAYPRWVRDGRMPQGSAEREIRTMEAVLETVRMMTKSGRLL